MMLNKGNVQTAKTFFFNGEALDYLLLAVKTAEYDGHLVSRP